VQIEGKAGALRGIALVPAHNGPAWTKQDRDKTSASANPATPTCVKVAINCKCDIHTNFPHVENGKNQRQDRGPLQAEHVYNVSFEIPL
jgi:hypothetical protein